MKIYTENFKKYSKVLQSLVEKGNKRTESIYFNFEDSYIYLFSTKSNSRMLFLWEKDSEDEVINNFSVPLDIFIPIVFQYQYLQFKDNKFLIGDEVFELQTFIDEDVDLSNFKDLKFNNNTELEIDTIFAKHLVKAINYIDKTGSQNLKHLNAIFIRRNKIVSTDRTKLYNGILENSLPDINLPQNLAITIANLSEKNNLIIATNDTFLYININNKVEILSSIDLSLSIPNIFDDDFVNGYDHDSYFILNRKEFLDIVTFLECYTKDVPNNRVMIELMEDKMNINVIDFNKIKRQIKFEEISESLIGKSFQISNIQLKYALSDVESDFIKFQVDIEKPAINVIGYNKKEIIENKNVYTKKGNNHIILSQLKKA